MRENLPRMKKEKKNKILENLLNFKCICTVIWNKSYRILELYLKTLYTIIMYYLNTV